MCIRDSGYYENSFVLKNISDVPLGKDWIIYYSQLPREILQEESAPVSYTHLYNFPKKWLNKIHLSRLQAYVTGQNLFKRK